MRFHTPTRNFVFVGKLLLLVVATSLLFLCLGSSDADKNSTLAVSELARPADSFVESIGVNLHLHYLDTSYGHFEIIKRELTNLGVRHARDGAQLTPTDANYDNLIYGRMRDLANSGIHFDLIVDPRAVPRPIADKIARIEQRGGPAIESLEGPNEYDNSGNKTWAKDLREYQEELYGAVKSQSSTKELAVVGPSLIHKESRPLLGDLKAYMDFGNTHCYPGGKDPMTHLDQEIQMSGAVNGTRAIYATETGYHNGTSGTTGQPGVSEEAAGKYIPRLLLEYFNHDISRSYLYEFADEKPDPEHEDPEQNFGLIRADGSEKPAYKAVRNLISLLKDPGPSFQPVKLDYTLRGDTQDIHHTLLQKRNGNFYLILWRETASYNTLLKTDLNVRLRPITVEFGRTVRRATMFSPNESASPITSNSNANSITLDVPDHPVIVEVLQ